MVVPTWIPSISQKRICIWYEFLKSSMCKLFVLKRVTLCNNCLLRIIIIIYSLRVFHISFSWWFFYWSLSDSKSPQVSRTLLGILAVFCNVVVWMVSACPHISKFSSPFNNPLVTVPKAPITISIIVTVMFHSFSISWWSFPGVWVTHKSPQISRTLLNILAILNNAVVWMVSTRPHISKSSSSFNNPLVTVLKAPIMIGIIIPLM